MNLENSVDETPRRRGAEKSKAYTIQSIHRKGDLGLTVKFLFFLRVSASRYFKQRILG
jgi:hypothetical protein